MQSERRGDMVELRKGQRARAKVEISDENAQEFYAGALGDLSYGGLLLVTDDPPEPGSELELSIVLPGGGLVRALGQVRWIRAARDAEPDRPAGCGVVWQVFDRATAETVRRFVQASDYTYVAAAS